MAFEDFFDNATVDAPWTAYGALVEADTSLSIVANGRRYADETTVWTGGAIYRTVLQVTNDQYGCGMMTLYDGSHPSPYASDGVIECYAFDGDGTIKIEVRGVPSTTVYRWNGSSWETGIVNTGYTLANATDLRIEYDFSTSPGNFIITLFDGAGVPVAGTPTTPRSTADIDWYGTPDGHISVTASAKSGSPGQGTSTFDWFGQDTPFPNGAGRTNYIALRNSLSRRRR